MHLAVYFAYVYILLTSSKSCVNFLAEPIDYIFVSILCEQEQTLALLSLVVLTPFYFQNKKIFF